MNSNVTEPSRTPSAEPMRQGPVFVPPFDIVETENELVLYGDMPGVREDQLDIRFENEHLLVYGKVTPRAAAGNGAPSGTVLREEYGVGDYRRTFAVGEQIDPERITAELHNGVLAIHLPKAEAAKPRKIQVKAV